MTYPSNVLNAIAGVLRRVSQYVGLNFRTDFPATTSLWRLAGQMQPKKNLRLSQGSSHSRGGAGKPSLLPAVLL